MEHIALAVIGGTGVYKLAALDDVQTHNVETRYGTPSGPVRVGRLLGEKVAFLARHGEGHSLPPHRINYRANLAALQQIGATRVLALNTVGGITDDFGPRVLACPDQLIDYTWGRISTLCEEPGSEVLHVDFGTRIRRHSAARCWPRRRRPACAWSTAAATARPRARGWKPSPRSGACAAMAATWSA
jgi:Purine nucleoside phosphorylase